LQFNNKISPIADSEIKDFLANKDLNFSIIIDKEVAYKNEDFRSINSFDCLMESVINLEFELGSSIR